MKFDELTPDERNFEIRRKLVAAMIDLEWVRFAVPDNTERGRSVRQSISMMEGEITQIFDAIQKGAWRPW